MKPSEEQFAFAPIGYFRGGAVRKYEAPRQGVLGGACGRVVLQPGHNFEMALRNLEGFERVWLVFVFHRNGRAWRPTTRPPVAAAGCARVGVFASRAPYRPNPIGMSCVRLVRIAGRTLEVAEADLLDGTPVLDIKPYVPLADAFPEAAAGWVERQSAAPWRVDASGDFLAAYRRVRAAGAPDVLATARVQLAHDPFDAARKRVTRRGAGARKGTLSLRMFRLDFTLDAAARSVHLTALRSGYTPAELAMPDDPYGDKRFHRALLDGSASMDIAP